MSMLKENQYIMQLCIIILLCWLGWLRGLASGQVSEAFTGSANFSNLQLTCLANLAAFIIFILRDKLWFEEQSKQGPVKGRVEYSLFLWLYWSKKLWFEEQSEQTASKGGILTKIEGLAGKTTCGKDLRRCHVVILLKQRPSPFFTVFLKLISSVHEVQSIFLKWLPLQSVEVSVEKCTENQGGRCGCIVFKTVEDITKMLARRMPLTLKLLPDSRCLLPSVSCLRNGCHSCQCILPSLNCLRNGCHGFNHGLLYVDENDTLTESNHGLLYVDSPAATVCEILDHLESFDKVGSCICIPVRSHNEDKWTDLLIRYLKADDKEFRGVVIRKGRTDASSALQNYKNRNHGECDADEEYSIASLFILPYLTRILIVLVLTLWLKVDGFSSTMLATRAVQNYITKRNYPVSPHWWLRRAVVKANGNKTNACQVLYFRQYLQRQALLCLSCSESVVIAYCILPWTLAWRIAAEGDDIPWFIPHFMIPSTGGIVMIVAGICIALVMDGIDLKLNLQIRSTTHFGRRIGRIKTVVICATMVLEILCIVAFSAIPFAFRIWIYGALQCLVLVKYGIGFLLLYMHEDLFSGDSREDGELTWWYRSCGLYTQSSAFLLNAILAGVRTDWKLPN